MRWDKLKLAAAPEFRGGRIVGSERMMVKKLAGAYLWEERSWDSGDEDWARCMAHERRAMQSMMQAALGNIDRRWWLDEAAWRLSRRWLRRGPSR